MKKCMECNVVLVKWQKKFCSKSCSAIFTNKLRPKKVRNKCPQCNVEVPLRNKFCSNRCSNLYHSPYDSEEESVEGRLKQQREANARYRAQRVNQTPVDADLDAIKEFYQNVPKGHEVDHIIPISKSGLHSLENLQYLTVYENRSKRDKIMEKVK